MPGEMDNRRTELGAASQKDLLPEHLACGLYRCGGTSPFSEQATSCQLPRQQAGQEDEENRFCRSPSPPVDDLLWHSWYRGAKVDPAEGLYPAP